MTKKIRYTCIKCGKEIYDYRPRKYCSHKCSGTGIIDLTGQRFGMLTAIERTEETNGSHKLWICKCDCGKYTKVPINFLKSGHTKSCGCLRKDVINRAKAVNPTYYEETNIARIEDDKVFKNNTSGHKGVHEHTDGGWIARIGFQNKRIYLGIYKTYEEALKVRLKAEKRLYKPIIKEYYENQNKKTSEIDKKDME